MHSSELRILLVNILLINKSSEEHIPCALHGYNAFLHERYDWRLLQLRSKGAHV